MSITRLRECLTAPIDRAGLAARPLPWLARGVSWWLFLSLLFAAVCGVFGLRQAFKGPYVADSDARQHVFWMARFMNPDLFPHDLIADYFQSTAPQGYTALYHLMAKIGLDPLLFSKLLPVVLGLIATGYCFSLSLQILPVPLSGFIAAVLLNQNIWMANDLSTGTPRAFAYPLLLAFLYYLSRRSLLPCLVTIVLQGLFYPQIVVLSAGVLILRLLHWQKGRIRLSADRTDYRFCLTGMGVSLFVLLLYAFNSSGFGPTLTAAQARGWPEFGSLGRIPLSATHSWLYWIAGPRSGLLPRPEILFRPELLLIGLLLPMALYLPSRFPLAKRLDRDVALLPQMLLASVGMFFAAHALLFRLHLPSRYTKYSFRIVMALAAGMALVLILDQVLQWAERNSSFLKGLVAWSLIALSAALLLHFPLSTKRFPQVQYVLGRYPSLYEFFSRQPRDILIASLTKEADNLPTFPRRSILTARKYALPYQTGYYRQFRQRTKDLIRAQYSSDLAVVQGFIRKYGVSFWLLERKSFTRGYVERNRWINLYQPEAREAANGLKKGEVPALAAFLDRCSVYEDERFVVLDARCILQAKRDKGTQMVAPSAQKRGSKVPEAEFPAYPSSCNRDSPVMGLPALGMGNALAVHLQSPPCGHIRHYIKGPYPKPSQTAFRRRRDPLPRLSLLILLAPCRTSAS